MEVLVKNSQKKLKLSPSNIKALAIQILKSENVKFYDLSLTFVTAQKIRALNIKYLKRSYVTDVLAFNLTEDKKHLVGDVIISTDAAIQYSRKHKTNVKEELALYIVHGILHLLGYDDHTKKDIAKMRKKEQQVLKYLGSRVKKILS